MAVLGSTRRPTTLENLVVTDLQHILTPLFTTVDIFSLVVPYLFDVCFFHDNDYCLGHKLDSMMPFVPLRIHKSYDIS